MYPIDVCMFVCMYVYPIIQYPISPIDAMNFEDNYYVAIYSWLVDHETMKITSQEIKYV